MRDVRVAAVQFESAAGDKEANFAKLERFTAEAAGRGVAILLSPECGLTGYWFLRRLTLPQLRALAEPVPGGPSCRRLADLAARHGLSVGAGLVEAGEADVFHNTYVVAMPDGRIVAHRKIHAFEHPAIRGGRAITVFDTPHGCRAAILVCYDNNIVENVRVAAARRTHT
jgi:N-carbamoylputrescine amidase